MDMQRTTYCVSAMLQKLWNHVDYALHADVADVASSALSVAWSAITGKPATYPPTAHAASHQNGGADEISVAGLSGHLADAQDPTAHATSHENGGGDEISVAGLSGVLADAQTPAAHAATHVTGGGDTIANVIAGGNAGLMSGVDKTKLDGIAAGAEVNVNADWNAVAGDAEILNKPATMPPSAHHADHENGGGDEISVAGLSGVLADDQNPVAHHLDHENGGGDEISVAGLSGLLADDQNPTAHHGDHENGGGDEISVAGLSGLLADDQNPIAHHGDHENGGGDEISVAGLSGVLADAQNADHLLGNDVPVDAHGILHNDGAGALSWAAEPAAGGDVTGPAGATGDDIAVFDGATGKAIKDGGAKVADLVAKALFDANTILKADADDTPVALTVDEQRLVGRITGGVITGLTAAQVNTLLGTSPVDVQVFTANGNWSKPAGKRLTQIFLIGGGAGAGAGRRGATNSSRSGGSAGGSGSYGSILVPTEWLGDTEAVVIGAGGAGAAGQAADNTNGSAGNNGGTSTFGTTTILTAPGGLAGLGGTTAQVLGTAGGGAATAAITPLSSVLANGLTGGNSGNTSAGGNGNSAVAGAPFMPGSGAGGGWAEKLVADYGGGTGGAGCYMNTHAGGTAGTNNGGAGGTGTGAGANEPLGGGGGGGGGGNTDGAGGDGGDGASYGASGGGGGPSVNGFVSGAGGDGEDGICVVISW